MGALTAAKLPQFLTRPVFNGNLKKTAISGMARNVLRNKSPDSELETLNGHFLQPADRYKLSAPYNRTVYDLRVDNFANPDFEPLDIEEIWSEVKQQL